MVYLSSESEGTGRRSAPQVLIQYLNFIRRRRGATEWRSTFLKLTNAIDLEKSVFDHISVLPGSESALMSASTGILAGKSKAERER